MDGVTVTRIDVNQITTISAEAALIAMPDGVDVASFAICSIFTDEGIKTNIPVIQNLRVPMNLSRIDENAVQVLMAGAASEVLTFVAEKEKKEWNQNSNRSIFR